MADDSSSSRSRTADDDANHRIIWTPADNVAASETCPICTEGYHNSNGLAARLNCGHIFCEQCILTWLKESKTCPMCRQEIFPPDEAEDGDSFDVESGNNQNVIPVDLAIQHPADPDITLTLGGYYSPTPVPPIHLDDEWHWEGDPHRIFVDAILMRSRLSNDLLSVLQFSPSQPLRNEIDRAYFALTDMLNQFDRKDKLIKFLYSSFLVAVQNRFADDWRLRLQRTRGFRESIRWIILRARRRATGRDGAPMPSQACQEIVFGL